MTVIPNKEIQIAFNSALATAFSTMPIAWENARYTPVIGTAFLRAWLLPAEVDVITLGPGPFQEHHGIFQVSVVYPIGVGFVTPKAKAAEVVELFRAGTVINSNTLRIVCEKAWPSTAIIEEDGWYFIPVSVRYRCETTD